MAVITKESLSRFDLIFVLVDKPDPDHDKKLSEHIMKVILFFKLKIHNQKRKRVPRE
jgi:DNA replicative helicase MCM subunit Mcm2 (Cdc46/Mcm family)